MEIAGVFERRVANNVHFANALQRSRQVKTGVVNGEGRRPKRVRFLGCSGAPDAGGDSRGDLLVAGLMAALLLVGGRRRIVRA